MKNSNPSESNLDLVKLRHSTEHVLMQAMENLFPGQIIKAMGPATDDGFYFDFDTKNIQISEEDFPRIEEEMGKIIKQDLPITPQQVSAEEAKEIFKNNTYKQEFINEIVDRGEPVTVYWTGNINTEFSFVDLCSGPHLDSTGQIKAFKLLSLAGAYWRGSEKNKMLSRIYGTAFATKEELDNQIKLLEEAKENDHRKIGKDLDLFTFSDLVGKGLPLFTPKGATIRRELERFIVDEEIDRGYQHVITPPLAKVDLYRTSGHYPYFQDTMYPLMKVDEEELILRPMTCPHHFMLYKSQPRSYRELPLRFAEPADLFRYEKSGELTGLIRVRMFCLADAHIFATKDQAKGEINRALDLIDYAASILGLEKGKDYRYRLSLGDRNDEAKYFKDDTAWDFAENILRQVLTEREAPFYEASHEAAFYGPKIDVQMKKLTGKEETAFTVQYDFVMPKRFDLKYIDETGSEQQPIVIHRSSIGAFERIMALLIEKYKGAFPLWLSPIQVSILPVSDKSVDYAKNLEDKLKAKRIRVELNQSSETLGKKIRLSEGQKIPYMLIIGEREATNNVVSVRARGEKDLGQMTVEDFIGKITSEIQNKVIS